MDLIQKDIINLLITDYLDLYSVKNWRLTCKRISEISQRYIYKARCAKKIIKTWKRKVFKAQNRRKWIHLIDNIITNYPGQLCLDWKGTLYHRLLNQNNITKFINLSEFDMQLMDFYCLNYSKLSGMIIVPAQFFNYVYQYISKRDLMWNIIYDKIKYDSFEPAISYFQLDMFK